MQDAGGELREIIRKAKGLDRLAFGELYRLSVTPLYRYLAARVDSASEAEDLTQEVFMAALGSIHGLRAEDEVGLLAWLFQIARYKLADHLRQRYRRPSAQLEEAEQLAAGDPRPDERAEREEDRLEVRRALEQLTPEQREVVICKYVLDFDNARTARVVGKNVNSVNQLHHHALASLHRLMARLETAL